MGRHFRSPAPACYTCSTIRPCPDHPRRMPPMQLKVSPISRQECSAQEWQARVDLAAAHRVAVMHGFHEGIFNHLTLAVPGKPDRYYQIPFGLHWCEIKASTFMEVGIADG